MQAFGLGLGGFQVKSLGIVIRSRGVRMKAHFSCASLHARTSAAVLILLLHKEGRCLSRRIVTSFLVIEHVIDQTNVYVRPHFVSSVTA